MAVYYKIVRCGKTDSYPFEDNAKYISPDGEHWQMIITDNFPFPSELIDKAYGYKLKKGERKEFIKKIF